MDPERNGTTLIVWTFAFALFNRIHQSFECTQSRVHGSGDRGREITGNPMTREHSFDHRQRLGGVVHDVISSVAMNVKIDVTRCDHTIAHTIAEVRHRNSGGNVSATLVGNFDYAPLIDEHERTLDGFGRGKKFSSRKSQHRIVLIAEKYNEKYNY